MILQVIAAGAALLLFAFVAIENLDQTVMLSFFGREVGPHHVFVLLIASVLIGALLGIAAMSARVIRLKRDLRRAARQVAALDCEVADLRIEPLGPTAPAEPKEPMS